MNRSSRVTRVRPRKDQAMRSARQSAIRVLQLMMVASVVLPAVLFVFASWLSYRHEHAVGDDRIERSLDILHEHALKVFQTVERAIAEVDEVTRGMPDDEIRADQPRLHERLKRIVDAMPQLRAIFLSDRDGRPLVSSQLALVPTDFDCGSELLQRARDGRCRHLRQRGAHAAADRRPGHLFLRSVAPPRLGGWLLQRRHGGCGAAALLRGVLWADRT